MFPAHYKHGQICVLSTHLPVEVQRARQRELVAASLTPSACASPMAAHSEEDLEEYLLPSGNPPPPPANEDLDTPPPSAPAAVEPLTEEKSPGAAQRPDASQIRPKTLDFGNHAHRPTKAPMEKRHVLIEKVTQTQPTTHVLDPRVALPLDNLAQDARQLETEIELEPLTQEPATIAFDFEVVSESQDGISGAVDETRDNPENSYSDEDSIQPQKMADDALNLSTTLQQLPPLVDSQSPGDDSRFVDPHQKSSVAEDSQPPAQQQEQPQPQLEPREAPQEPNPKTLNDGIGSTTSTEQVSADVNDLEEIEQPNPQNLSEPPSATVSKTGEESSSVRVMLPSATNENEDEDDEESTAQHDRIEKEGAVSRESPQLPPPSVDGSLAQNDDEADEDDSPVIQRSRARPSPDTLQEGDDDATRDAAAENNDADTSPDRNAPLRRIMSQAQEHISDEEQIEREIGENVGRGRGRLLSHLRRPSSDSSEAESSEDGVEEVLVTRPSQQKDDSDDSIIIQSVRGPSLTPEKRTPLRRSRRINPVAIELDDDDDDSDEVLEVDVTPKRRVGQSSDDSVPRLSQTTRAEVEADMDSDSSGGNDWLNVRARAGRTQHQSPTKRRQQRKPKRRRVSIISDEEDDDSEILRPSKRRRTQSRSRKKKTSKRRVIEISSDDSEERYRPRKRQRRPRVQPRKAVGYRRDGFVVSDASDVYDSPSSAEAGDPDDDDDGYDNNDEGDVSESDEEEDFANVSSSMRKAMKKALKGKRLPFRGGLICAICRWTGAPALGTAANGYRDGFIQPLSNFSANVRRGNYGVRMQEPFCLSHTAGDQNEYVQRLALTAERNKSLYDSESRSEEEEEENNSNSVTEVISDDESPMNSNNTARGSKENVELSAEKVLLNVPGAESNEAIMHGAEYDWNLSCYVAMPGTNLVPLKKWIIEEID